MTGIKTVIYDKTDGIVVSEYDFFIGNKNEIYESDECGIIHIPDSLYSKMISVANVAGGDIFDGLEFETVIDFSSLTMEDAAELVKCAIEGYASASLSVLSGDATPEERDTWGAKERQAKLWLKENDVVARDILAGMVSDMRAQKEGIDPADVDAKATYQANRILTKAAVMYAIIRAVEYNRDSAYVALEACTDVDAMLALLDTIQAEAGARLEQFMAEMSTG